jgi:hypothetical protein
MKDLDALSKEVAERIGSVKIPESFHGPASPLFNLDSCAGGMAVEAVRPILASVLDEHKAAVDWLKAIHRDPTIPETMRLGLEEYFTNHKTP